MVFGGPHNILTFFFEKGLTYTHERERETKFTFFRTPKNVRLTVLSPIFDGREGGKIEIVRE